MKSKATMLARLARRQVRRLSQMARWRRLGLGGVPVLFANSFPKSGTHLLTQVLHGFVNIGPAVDSGLPAVVTYQGDSGRKRSSGEILAELDRLLPGDIAYGHLHARPEIAARLAQPGFASYFILRDPRDVVVSHVHYVTEMEPNHAWHAYYNQELHSFDERLETSIRGVPGEVTFVDIRARFEPFLGWLEQPEVLCMRYEDFLSDRPAALAQVLGHAVQRGFPLREEHARAVQVLAESIDPKRSPTFRSGKAGGWREKFSAQHRAVFKEVAGDLLERLGYEADGDW